MREFSVERLKVKNTFWVVGIGASAGGLEALTRFVSALPTQSNACFVVAHHLAPHSKSMMVELLSRHSPIEVNVVVNQMELVPNKLFIVPPNHDVDVIDHKLVLTKAGEETRPKPSVDRFFASLAADYGVHAIGVILSGTGSDGAKGTRLIKEAGGVTLAQEENSAKFSGMPNSASDTGQVDFILNPEDIARKVSEIILTEAPYAGLQEPEDSDPTFQKLLTLIRSEIGNDFSQYKIGTIKRRLAKRMANLMTTDLASYLEILNQDEKELRALAQEFLVSVTSFFRDPEAFKAVEKEIQKIIEAKRDGEEVRIWSAGCATGEEAYSLAIMTSELIQESRKNLNLKVFATDLDTDAISKARLGVYSERELGSVQEDHKERYFDQRGEMFEVKKMLRDRVVFARQDLIQSPPFVKLDLISCRNVIIYFEPSLQKKVFDIFNYALKPMGILFLGKSEAIQGATELFEPLDKKFKIFRKITLKVRQLPPTVRNQPQFLDAPVIARRSVRVQNTLQTAQAQILERYGIAGALVTADGTIDTIVGDVSKYLKIPAGLDNFKLQALLPKQAAVEFQLLLKKASKQGSLQVSRAFKLNDGSNDYFQIKLSSLDSREQATTLSPALLLVSFDKLIEGSIVAHNPTASEGDLELRTAELEQELAATKEHLQTVIEELGVTNEELQSTNEELSSTNEELQSSNEELETTNEEFQSTNEELTTINDELILKTKELRTAYTDLENIQNSIGVPMLVVDESLRLQRFNPSTTELFDISLNDVGRSISKLSARCEIEEFSKKVKKVMETSETAEFKVEAYRAVYQMRISPRVADNQKVVGAVIFFFNNTDLIQTEQKLRRSERRMRDVVDGTSSLIFLKDISGRYIAANEAFNHYFRFQENQILGKSDREIFSDEFANQMRNGDLEAILKRTRVEKQEEFYNKSNQSHSSFLVSRFPLFEEDGHTIYAVCTVASDITAQIHTQAALKRSESRYRGVVEDQTVFVMRFDSEGQIIFANAAFARYFGKTAEDYIGHSLYQIVDSADRSQVRYDLSTLSLEKSVVQFEHRFSQYGTNPRWIRWIAKAVFDDGEKLVEIQAVGFDVTESRQQTEQMVQREILFSNIFTYTADFMTVFKVTSQNELLLESFNRTVDDSSGFTYAQFIGRNVRDLVTSQDRDQILEKYRLCIEQKSPQTFEEELFIQGASKYLATTIIPVLNNAGVVERVVTLGRDISKYKIAEAELNAAKAAAEIANESKSDFLASMSHELRSPLNVVIGMADLLQSSNIDKSAKAQVESIQRSGKVLLTLIEDILDISKIEAGKTKFEYNSFSLRELANDVKEAFTLQAQEKEILLELDFKSQEIDFFVGDVNRIRQVLTNLVSNAIKFTEKGQVTIIISSIGHKSAKSAGRRLVRFEVQDTGIGIPEEHHSRIFKKFSQVDSGLGRKYGGTGLGLVISQRLTTLMHGQIGFSSEWNKGSLFWFELPLSVAKQGHEKNSSAKSNNPAESKANGDGRSRFTAKILAVDDGPDNRLLLDFLLKRMGHNCKLVDSGAEALTLLKKETYDLILMDIQMPGMDGYECTMKIRKLDHPNSKLPIIALTANAMVGDSEKCFDAGMNDYVTKPINPELLRGVIEKWTSIRQDFDKENSKQV